MSDNVYSLGQSDVWVSADLGATFVNVTTSSIYSPRTSASSTIWTATAGDIMVMLGGEAPNGVWLNDVWVSQTSARSWIQVTPAAPWQVRGGAALASTAAGVLVMQGGQGYVSGSNQWWTDAWVSLDGAATWTQLSEAAGPARSYPGSLFDPSGYFYVFSGNVNYAWQTGGQKSSLSVLNIQQWAAIVNGTLTYPAGYNPCAPYINFAAAVAPTGGASSSSSAATAASSAVQRRLVRVGRRQLLFRCSVDCCRPLVVCHVVCWSDRFSDVLLIHWQHHDCPPCHLLSHRCQLHCLLVQCCRDRCTDCCDLVHRRAGAVIVLCYRRGQPVLVHCPARPNTRQRSRHRALCRQHTPPSSSLSAPWWRPCCCCRQRGLDFRRNGIVRCEPPG